MGKLPWHFCFPWILCNSQRSGNSMHLWHLTLQMSCEMWLKHGIRRFLCWSPGVHAEFNKMNLIRTKKQLMSVNAISAQIDVSFRRRFDVGFDDLWYILAWRGTGWSIISRKLMQDAHCNSLSMHQSVGQTSKHAEKYLVSFQLRRDQLVCPPCCLLWPPDGIRALVSSCYIPYFTLLLSGFYVQNT